MIVEPAHYPKESDYKEAIQLLYSSVDVAGDITAYTNNRLQDQRPSEQEYREIARRIGARLAFDRYVTPSKMDSGTEAFVAGSLLGLDLALLAYPLKNGAQSGFFRRFFNELDPTQPLRQSPKAIIATGRAGTTLCGQESGQLIGFWAKSYGPHGALYEVGVGLAIDEARELTLQATERS